MHERLRLSRYVVASDRLTVGSDQAIRVVFSTRSCTPIRMSEGLWQTLVRGELSAIADGQLQALAELLVLVDASEDELQNVLADNQEAIVQQDTLDQVIQPSAACQLGCTYCGQQHQARHMAEHVQEMLVRRVSRRLERGQRRRRPYRALTVGWFGGEPLLGLGAMRRLSPLLVAAATAADCTYSARVVTNGLRLTPAIARELEDEHYVSKVEVTLDGPARWHDARRPTKSGRATFDLIMANLKSVAKIDSLSFRIVIRCNVDRHNADAIPELIELLKDAGLHERVELYFSPVYSWGNDADAGSLEPEDYAARETEWLASMIEVGFGVDLLPQRRPIVCLAVQPEARVIDAFGTEFDCTEAPYVPSYGQPNMYATGHVDGSEVGEPSFLDFNAKIRTSQDLGCARCVLLPACGGACPKSWADGHLPCPSTKLNLADRLILNVAQHQLRSATPGAPTEVAS